MKILYVEDEPAHFELTQRALEEVLQDRFVLYHVDSVRRALRVLEMGVTIDLILTDLHLPDGTGLDILKRVKEYQPAPAVVLVTGQGDQQIAVTALKAGAADYLVKEGDYLHRLPVIISNAVAQNQLVREQAALRAAEKRFRVLVEQLPAAVYTDNHDEYSSVLYISPQIEDISGYTVEEWMADPMFWLEHIHPDDLSVVQKELEATHESYADFNMEYRMFHRNGSIVWIRDYAKLVLDANGKPKYWQGLLFDITKNIEAQETIKASEDRFKRIFHSTPIATCVVTIDDGRFIDANTAFLNLIGIKRENLLNHRVLEFGFWEKPTDRLNFINRLIECRSLQDVKFQYRNVPNGPKDTLAYYELIELDGAECILAMFYDVTEQIKTQQALERQVTEQTALHAMARAESESLSEDEIITSVTTALHDVFHEVCGILLLDSTGEILTPHISYIGADVSSWQEGYPITEGITGRAVSTGAIIRLGDVTKEPGYIEIATQTKSELCVPIRVYERIIGVINVESKSADTFTEHDENFLLTVSNGLGNALERIRLFALESKRREEAETLRQAASLISSTLNLDEVVNEILSTLKKIIPYDSGTVFFHEGDYLRIAMAQGYPHAHQLINLTFPADDELFQIMRSTHRPIIIDDVRVDPRFKNWGETSVTRSWMALPLISRGNVVGYLSLDSHKPAAFNETIGKTTLTFAHQAAAAIYNAQLYDETQRRLRELEIINRISASLREAQSVNQMIHILLEEGLLIANTSHGSIWLFDPVDNMLVREISRGSEENSPIQTLRPGEGIAGYVFGSGEKYITPDLKNDLLLHPDKKESTPPGLSGIYIPIKSGSNPIGVVMVAIEAQRRITEEINLLTILADMTSNAIHRAELFDQSQEQIHRLTTLREIDSAIVSSTDLKVTLSIVMNHTLKHLKVDAVAIMSYYPELQSLTFFASAGFHDPDPSRPIMRLGEGLSGNVVLRGDLLYIADLRQSEEIKKEPILANENFVTYFGVPLIVKGQIRGVFEIFIRSLFTPSADWLHFMHTLAGQAAIALDNSQLFDNLQRSNQEITQAYDTTLEGWAHALELRDRETEGHTRRVTELTMKLAQFMGITGEELTNIYRGVLLHDIGKMGVSDQILRKTGPLNDSEWSEMRRHPEYAFKLLLPIPYLRPALDIPYYHHEHWDGSGYPKGLKGEQIPLAARIFSIVDIWDALLSDRSYRKAWPRGKVIQYLKDISGTILDPHVVESFMKMLEEETEK